jgi:hypothetical protein
MSWREAVRLSDVAFSELSLQAIYAFRQGNLGPSGPARLTVARSRRRVLQSKAIVSLVLGLVTFGGAVVARGVSHRATLLSAVAPPGVLQAGVLTGLLSLDVAFLWWTGMQVLPTFLASGVLPVLEALPIEEQTLNRATGLVYLRLFDYPALTVLILTPLFVGLALGPIAGLAIVPGAFTVVAFSLGLSLLTGRFFVRRVQGSRGGGGRAIVRWTYLILWLIPAFAMFAFVVTAPAFFALLGNLAAQGPSLGGHLLLVAFPFPLATLPALAASGSAGLGLDATGWSLLAAGVVVYVGLAAWTLTWMMVNVRRVSFVPAVTASLGSTAPWDLRPQVPTLAVLTKDLRIASRTPGFAFLVLLPVLDSVAIGLLTFVTAPGSAAAFSLALAAVTTAALLATFFGPAFFAIEVFAYSYGRTLPISDRSLLSGKVLLIAAMYLVAGGTVLGITLARVFDPVLFAAFILAELPAVAAAALLELGLVFRRARAKGLPMTNLYAGAWYTFFVSIPGVVVAGAPLLMFHYVSATSAYLGLFAMGLVALGELAVATALMLGRRGS